MNLHYARPEGTDPMPKPCFSSPIYLTSLFGGALALSACAEPVELEARVYENADLPDATDESFGLTAVDDASAFAKVDVSTYSRVTRQDFRKCIYPLCGSVFVERVNKAKTTCADGIKAAECYVAVADLSALSLDGTKMGAGKSPAPSFLCPELGYAAARTFSLAV